MRSIIIRLISNIFALWLATRLEAGFIVQGGWHTFLFAGVVLAILNLSLRPLLKLITFPLIILTLGLFNLVINGIVLWLLDYLLPSINIVNLGALAWATIIIWLTNLLVTGGLTRLTTQRE